MRRFITNIISVLWTMPRLLLKKIALGKNFHSDLIERISPNVVLEFSRGATVTLGHQVRIHSGSKLKVRKGAELFIGSGVRINYNFMLFCQTGISIGEGTEFGPNVCVYDHDHDYRSGLKKELFLKAPVSIGKNCWIGADVVILRGTVIGDNCVIGAGTIVKGSIPANSVVYQKRETVIVPQEGQE